MQKENYNLKEKIKILITNNKNKNNRVIYEALANKLRSSLLGDDIISYILDSYILILTEINEQFLTFYLKNEWSVM